MEDLLISAAYTDLLGEIKSRIRTAQYDALRAVNKELISLYWNIGELIVERQQGATWGTAVVKKLADDIQREFPGIQGSRLEASNICASFTSPTEVVKNCHHWWHKLDGAIIGPS